MTRRLIALLLCICMIGSMTVYATDDVTEPSVPESSAPASEPTVPESSEPASEPTVPESSEPASEPTVPESSGPASEPTVPESSAPVSEPTVPTTVGDDTLGVPESETGIVSLAPVVKTSKLAGVKAFSGDDPTSVGGLVYDKNVAPNGSGYKVSLEAYTTGEVIHATTGNKVDIILVLDMSKQMQTGNRLAEMKEAAVSFIESSVTTDGSRRIALVTYNNAATVRSGSLTDNDAALVNITPDAATTMCQTVNALTGPAGASNIDQGMMKAAHIFQDGNSKVPLDRQRIVILLSAGVFGSGNLIEVEGKDHNGRTQIRQKNIEDLRVGERGLLLGSIIKTARDQTAPIQNSQAYFDGVVTKEDFTTFFGSNFTGCGAEMYCIGVGMPKAVLGSATYGDFKANYNDEDKRNPDGTWKHPTNFWKNYGVLGTMINEVMYRMSSHRPDSSHVGGSQYNSWEQDWKILMNENGYATWPTQHGFWEGHYWDNYTRNLHENFPDRCPISYFITTDDASDLSSIFNTINQNIGEVTSSLPSTTVMKDIVTPHFDMPVIPSGGTVKDVVKVYTMDYNGTDFVESTKTDITNSVTVNMDSANRSVSVTGYEFDENYVTDEGRGSNNAFFGKKLIIEFDITVTEGFLGGDQVLTNESESGIYSEDGEELGIFPEPNVDIELVEISPNFVDTSIYLSKEADIPQIANIGKYKLTADGPEYTVNGINNDYVIIEYTISDGTNSMTYTIPAGAEYDELQFNDETKWTKIGDICLKEVLTGDTTYDVSCKIISKNLTTNTKEVAGAPKIDVYKPEVTFKDSLLKMGSTPVYKTENYVSVVWKHGETEADTAAMGAAPTLEYTYSPVEAVVNMETPVKVIKVTSSEKDMVVTGHTTFVREACGICGYEGGKVDMSAANPVNFIIHLKKFDLKIVKDVEGNYIDPNQIFLFHVTGPNGFDVNLRIDGEGEITIKDLPAGTYSVEELVDWSWRYVIVGDVSQSVKASDANENDLATVMFVNKREEDKWLSGDSFARNWWGNNGKVDRSA